MRELTTALETCKGITLDSVAAERFEAYYRLLAAKNSVMNLIGDADRKTVAVRHFLDSLMLIPAGVTGDTRLIDIGSGAGFPGLPLKIALPELRLTLLDATAKRTAFLTEVVEALSLDGVDILTGRAEEFANDGRYRGAFDAGTARAVASLPMLLELSLPFLRAGGQFFAPKSKRAEEELAGSRALSVLGAKRLPDHPYALPGDMGEFLVFRCELTRSVGGEYPRRFSKIKASPL